QQVFQSLGAETLARLEFIGFLRAGPAGPAGAGLGPGHRIGHVEIIALAGGDDDVVAALGQRRVDRDIAPADDIGLVAVHRVTMGGFLPATGRGTFAGDIAVHAADELGLQDGGGRTFDLVGAAVIAELVELGRVLLAHGG